MTTDQETAAPRQPEVPPEADMHGPEESNDLGKAVDLAKRVKSSDHEPSADERSGAKPSPSPRPRRSVTPGEPPVHRNGAHPPLPTQTTQRPAPRLSGYRPPPTWATPAWTPNGHEHVNGVNGGGIEHVNGRREQAERPAAPLPVLDPPPPPPPPARKRITAGRDDTLSRILSVVALGAVLGGLLGLLAGSVTDASSSASSLVQLVASPDPGLSVDGGGATSDQVADFTAAEIAWLSGDALSDAVQAQLGLPKAPDLTVARVGLSSVVRFSATGKTPDAALKVTQTAVNIYLKRRLDVMKGSISDSLDSVDKTIAAVQQDPAPTRTNADGTDRLSRLYDVRANLLLLQNRTSPPVPVLEQPTVEKTSSSPAVVGVILGAVVGGLLAITLFIFWRSRTNKIITVADTADFIDTVLHPRIRLDRDWRTRSLQVLRQRDRYAARLLVAQLAQQRTLAGRVVAVVGASAQSASPAVATMIAVGVAEQTPTVLGIVDGRPEDHPLASSIDSGGSDIGAERTATDVEGLHLVGLPERPGIYASGWTSMQQIAQAGGHCIVVDLGSHAELLRMLPAESEKVLVVGLGVDNKPHTEALAASIQTGPAGLTGVVTRLPWRLRLRRPGFAGRRR